MSNDAKEITLFGQYLVLVKREAEKRKVSCPPLGDVKDAYDEGLPAKDLVKTWMKCEKLLLHKPVPVIVDTPVSRADHVVRKLVCRAESGWY